MDGTNIPDSTVDRRISFRLCLRQGKRKEEVMLTKEQIEVWKNTSIGTMNDQSLRIMKDELIKHAEEIDLAEYSFCRAWQRELQAKGDGLFQKTHLIDSLVMTTQVLVNEVHELRAKTKGTQCYVWVVTTERPGKTYVFESEVEATKLFNDHRYLAGTLTLMEVTTYKKVLLNDMPDCAKNELGIK